MSSNITEIGFENWKIFKEFTEFKLKPITILTGTNASGKSSAIDGFYSILDFISSYRTDNLFISKKKWDNIPNNNTPKKNVNFYLNVQQELSIENEYYNDLLDMKISIKLKNNNKNNDFIYSSLVHCLSFNSNKLVEYSLLYGDKYFIRVKKKNQKCFNVSIDLECYFKLFNISYDKLFCSKSESVNKCLKILLNKLTLDLDVIFKGNVLFIKGNENLDIEFKNKRLNEMFSNKEPNIIDIYEGFVAYPLKIFEILESKKLSSNIFGKFLENHKSNDVNITYINKNDLSFNIDIINEFRYSYICYQNNFHNILLRYEFFEDINNIIPVVKNKNYKYLKERLANFGIMLNGVYNSDNEISSDFINYWIKKFEIGDKIINKINSSDIKIKKESKEISLIHLGFGICQLVPLIIDVANKIGWNSQQQHVYVSEPESNLHPNFQSLLADFFVDAYKKFGIRFIIETHSEYLIRKLQYLTAKKELKTDDSVIYYLSDPSKISKDEKQVKEIFIKEDGRLSDQFGPGFFDESANLVKSIWEERSKN